MDTLFIYHISWARFGCEGLNAVVVAHSGTEALAQIHFLEGDKCRIFQCIGAAFSSFKEVTVLSQESL